MGFIISSRWTELYIVWEKNNQLTLHIEFKQLSKTLEWEIKAHKIHILQWQSLAVTSPVMWGRDWPRVSSMFQVEAQREMRIQVTRITFEYQRMMTTWHFWNSQVSLIQENEGPVDDLWRILSFNLLHHVQDIYLIVNLKILYCIFSKLNNHMYPDTMIEEQLLSYHFRKKWGDQRNMVNM